MKNQLAKIAAEEFSALLDNEELPGIYRAQQDLVLLIEDPIPGYCDECFSPLFIRTDGATGCTTPSCPNSLPQHVQFFQNVIRETHVALLASIKERCDAVDLTCCLWIAPTTDDDGDPCLSIEVDIS